MPKWNVKLAVSGPISTEKPLSLRVQKGFELPFWTEVKINKAANGIWIKVVAKASTKKEANDAAVFFVGQMLDVLCLWTNQPLYLSLFDEKFRSYGNRVQRIIEEKEWKDAFRFGREYGLGRRIYSRSLSWYRKGVISEDPIDKFLAFWSSLEGFGSASARRNDVTRRGAINQICDCLDQLWGSVERWKVISNDAQWINRFHNTRNGIAHGSMTVNVDTIQEISEQLPKLRELAHTFLSEWENHGNRDYE